MDHLFSSIILRSGARLITVESDLPIASFSAWFYAGARLDPTGKGGLAHFFEHLLVRRTTKYPNAQNLIREMSRHGLFYNATTTHEPVWYFYEGPQEKTTTMVELLISGLQTSMINEEDVERERRAISDELDRKYNNPMQYLSSLRHIGLWPQSSLGRPVLGTKESLAKISIQDVKDFQKMHYDPSNATFVYIGNESTETIMGNIEDALLATKQETPKSVEAEIFSAPKSYIIDERKNDQTAIGINFRGPAENNFNDGLALDLLINYYLSNTWISRLVQRLRIERGITYWVNGSVGGFRDTGYAGLSLTVSPKHVSDAIDIITEEISAVKNGEISREDFDGAKTLMRSAFLRKGMNPSALMQWYGWQAICGDTIRTPKEYESMFAKLGAADLQRAASIYLTSANCSIACVGNIKEEDLQLPL